MSTIALNREIVQTLCNVGGGVAESGLLIGLQSRFPDSNWTSELLSSLLQQGKKDGLFSQVGSNPTGGATGWTVNKLALQTNYPKNKYYKNDCNNFVRTGCCNAGCGSC